MPDGISPMLYLKMVGRTRAVDDLHEAIADLIFDYEFSPGDLTDEIRNGIEIAAENRGIEHSFVQGDIEFFGDEDNPARQFPWEREDS